MRKVTQGVTQQDKDNVGGTASEEFGGGTLVSLLKRALVVFHCDFGLSFSRVKSSVLMMTIKGELFDQIVRESKRKGFRAFEGSRF